MMMRRSRSCVALKLANNVKGFADDGDSDDDDAIGKDQGQDQHDHEPLREQSLRKNKSTIIIVARLIVELVCNVWNEIKKRAFLLTRGRYWFNFRKSIRSLVQRSTIYVLECENGKYYVGSTRNKRKRFREHLQHQQEEGGRRASVWTQTNKPIRILQQYRRVRPQFALGLESQVTAEAMLQYGVNNVRGAMFADPMPYTKQNLDSLTRFLGHYNNLNYRDVRLQLEMTLPPKTAFQYNTAATTGSSTNKRRKRNRKHIISSDNVVTSTDKTNDRCFRCGQKGHWAVDCPQNNDQKIVEPLVLVGMPEINGNSKRVLLQPDTAAAAATAAALDNDYDDDDDNTRGTMVKSFTRKGFNNVFNLNKSPVDPNDRCFNCGEKGHWAAQCPNDTNQLQ